MTCLYDHSSATITEIDAQTLFLRVGGDIREEDLDPFFEALGASVDARSPTRILVDATYFGETPVALRWQIAKRLRTFRGQIERTAIYGLSPKLEALLWLLFTLGRRSNVRSFLWRHEAEGWVQGEPSGGLYA